MNLKTFLLVLLGSFIGIWAFTTTAAAQDKIYLKNGAEIDGKVTSLRHHKVWYTLPVPPNDSDYTVLKDSVIKIVYPDGNTTVFFVDRKKEDSIRDIKRGQRLSVIDQRPPRKEEHWPVKPPKVHDTLSYRSGKNIFSITPLAYTKSIDATINDAGAGLSYERMLDTRGRISINIPAIFALSSSRDYNNHVVTNSTLGGISSYSAYHSFWFMPGVKVYTAPDNRKVRFAFGASLFCVFGTEPYGAYQDIDVVSNNTGNGVTSAHNYTMYGAMATGAMNVMLAKHIRLTLDLSMGMPVYDNRYLNDYGQAQEVLSPFLQCGVKLGYSY